MGSSLIVEARGFDAAEIAAFNWDEYMYRTVVYLGLGGNVGDPFPILNACLYKISQIEEIEQLKISRFYRTSPVGNSHLDPFINTACCFITSLDPKRLLRKMQEIEISLGKVPKPKDAPRPIDIDILFYGSSCYCDQELQIPHPAWMKRLFVLVPLFDLISEIEIFSDQMSQRFILKDLIQILTQDSNQTVSLLEKNASLD